MAFDQSAWDWALKGQQPEQNQTLAYLPQRAPTSLRPAPSFSQPDTANEPAVVGDPRGKVLPRDISSLPFNPESTSIDKQQLLAMLKQQQEGSNSLQALAEKYKKLMGDQGKGDMGGLLALADSAFGTNTLQAAHAVGAVKPKLSEEEKIGNLAKIQEMVDKSRTPIAQEMLKLYGGENNNLQRALASQTNLGTKMAKDQNKAYDDAEKNILMTGRNVSKAASQAQEKLGRINSAMGLVDAARTNPDPANRNKYDPSQLQEFTSAVAATVNNTNVVTDKMREALQIKNYKTDAASIEQWFLAEPKGIEQTKWVERLVRTLGAEHKGAINTIEQFHKAAADLAQGRVSDDQYKKLNSVAKTYRESSFPSPLRYLNDNTNQGQIEVRNAAGVVKYAKPEALEEAAKHGFMPTGK